MARNWNNEDSPPTPNAETQRAIDDSYAGRVQRFGSVSELLADADDPAPKDLERK